MRIPALLTLALLLLMLAAPAIDAQGPGVPGSGPAGRRGGERERVAADEEARDWGNLSENARQRGLQRAEAARLFSQMEYEDGRVSSRFVSFNYTNGSLSDFAVRSGDNVTTYFDLDVRGFETAQPRVTGANFRAMGNETFFAAHGNPLGLLAYRVRNTPLTMTFDLASGVNVTRDNAQTFMLVGPTGLHGHVVISENASYNVSTNNRSVEVSLGPHARLLFIHHAPQTPFSASLHALRDGAATGRAGGMLGIVGDDEGPVQDRIFLGGVAMRATHAKDGRVDVVVSSENEKGRAVVIHVDAASVGLGQGANVTVSLDGQAIPVASSAAEAMNSSSALAHVDASNGALSVVVAVPTFSDHTITISAASVTTQPTPTPTVTPSPTVTTHVDPSPTPRDENGAPGPAIALLVACVALLALARRRA